MSGGWKEVEASAADGRNGLMIPGWNAGCSETGNCCCCCNAPPPMGTLLVPAVETILSGTCGRGFPQHDIVRQQYRNVPGAKPRGKGGANELAAQPARLSGRRGAPNSEARPIPIRVLVTLQRGRVHSRAPFKSSNSTKNDAETVYKFERTFYYELRSIMDASHPVLVHERL
jgi:hypothetical protein